MPFLCCSTLWPVYQTIDYTLTRLMVYTGTLKWKSFNTDTVINQNCNIVIHFLQADWKKTHIFLLENDWDDVMLHTKMHKSLPSVWTNQNQNVDNCPRHPLFYSSHNDGHERIAENFKWQHCASYTRCVGLVWDWTKAPPMRVQRKEAFPVRS